MAIDDVINNQVTPVILTNNHRHIRLILATPSLTIDTTHFATILIVDAAI